MASLSMRRLSNSLLWQLNLISRSRTLVPSCPHTSRISIPSRHFSSTNFRAALADTTVKTDPNKSKPTFSYNKPNSGPTEFTANTSKPHEPPPTTARSEEAKSDVKQPIRVYNSGLADAPPDSAPGNEEGVDWTRSFSGLSQTPFSKEAAAVLMEPTAKNDIEIKPDGIIYLPEIKYRRILNKAFGPGGWGLAPRGETIVTARSVTREYALLAHGRLVSIARGEQDYFDSEGIPTATEGCKSNALMRCCKDLGVASELWDPRFIRKFLAENAKEVWVEHVVTKKRKKITMRKDDEIKYPFKITTA